MGYSLKEERRKEIVKQDNCWFKFYHSSLLFIFFLIFFVCYLISTNLSSPPPGYAFWAILIPLFFLVVWQIGQVKDDPTREYIVLAEICFLGFALLLIFVLTVPYGLFGRDIYHDYYATKMITEHGWPIPQRIDILDRTLGVSRWPAIHILAGMASKALNIDLFSVTNSWAITKWLPSIISVSPILLIFIVVKRMYHTPKVSLLTALAFSSLFYHMNFHSWFVRETIAFPILFLAIYFLVTQLTDPARNRITATCLMILSMISLLISHHLTFLFLIIILVAFLVVLSPLNQIGKRMLNWSFPRSRLSLLLPTLAIVLFFTYLMYVGAPLFSGFVLYFKRLFEPVLVSAYVTKGLVMREQVILFGYIFFYMSFAILIINQILRNKRRDVTWDILGFLFIVLAVFLIIVDQLAEAGSILGMRRIEAFTLPLVLAGAAHSIYHLRHTKLMMYLIALFMLFQVYLISPYVYDHHSEPLFYTGEVSMAYNLADFKAVEWLEAKHRIFGGIAAYELLGGLKQAKVVTDVPLFDGSELGRAAYYDWFVVRSEDFKLVTTLGGRIRPSSTLSPDTIAMFESSPSFAKVYTAENVWIYNRQGE